MAKILVLNSSVKPANHSRATSITKLFVEEYKLLNPNDVVEIWNLNEISSFQKVMNQNTLADFWNEEDSQKYIDILKNTDKLIVSSPMINLGDSPLLRSFVDHIVVANKTFSYQLSKDPEGKPVGLLSNLTVQTIVTKGSPAEWYKEFIDLGEYINGRFKFLGMKTKPALTFGGMDMPPLASLSPDEVANHFATEIKKAAQNF